jgi:predicted nucleic acid-binding protein
VQLLDFDAACAERFGQVRGSLLQQGITVSRMDLLIASVALVHNLTLVTHNPRKTGYLIQRDCVVGSAADAGSRRLRGRFAALSMACQS